MIYSYKVLLAVLICVPFASGLTATSGKLPESVVGILSAHEMPVDSLSVFVQEVNENTPLLAVNVRVPRNPASTIKLLTTFVALEDLGPAYTWKTEAYLGGELKDGTLDGDLYLKGYGDPYLVMERFWLFLRQIRQRGLRKIGGDVVIDNSYFEVDAGDPGIFDGQADRAYNVIPDAFLVNFQAIKFTFRPDLEANGVQISADPMPSNLDIENRLQLTGGYCGGYQNGIRADISDSSKLNKVTFSGHFGRNCQIYQYSRSVLRGPTYAYGVFRGLWEEMGAELQGSMRLGRVPQDTDPFVLVESPPLSDVIRGINKWSNNVMARHLLLTMGVERFGPPATVDKGREAATMYLTESGLDFPHLHLDNGAGLSRKTRISAESLGRILLAANDSIYRAEFVSSLPLAGVDGTLRRRFQDEGLTGHMHLKTGRLSGVFAMAGYVRAQSGRQYAVVTIQNHANAHRGPGEEAQAALLRWVYKQ
jgi:D-alanyl-D-alanine carboxypeptidase/D-alanyl-D-alanine-endopeptidase (penicillin-binding protein 4)